MLQKRLAGGSQHTGPEKDKTGMENSMHSKMSDLS